MLGCRGAEKVFFSHLAMSLGYFLEIFYISFERRLVLMHQEHLESVDRRTLILQNYRPDSCWSDAVCTEEDINLHP